MNLIQYFNVSYKFIEYGMNEYFNAVQCTHTHLNLFHGMMMFHSHMKGQLMSLVFSQSPEVQDNQKVLIFSYLSID